MGEGDYEADEHLEIDNVKMKEMYQKEVSFEAVHSETIKSFLHAQKALEEINFLKVVGHDPSGIMVYMIFGHKFPAKDNDQYRMYIRDMIQFINSR